MPKKKIGAIESGIAIKITGPDCKLGDRLLLPGEITTVPADIAAEWIQTERAAIVTAEVKNGDWQNDQ